MASKTVKKLVGDYEKTASKAEKLQIPKVESFTDSSGTVWKPRITTPVLVETCRETGLTIANLMDFNINIADLFEALWLSCRAQATELQVSKELFMERVTPDVLPLAFSCYWGKVAKAFPSMKFIEKLQGGPVSDSGPLGSGKSKTS